MLGVGANDHNLAVSANDLALFAHRLNWRSYFHLSNLLLLLFFHNKYRRLLSACWTIIAESLWFSTKTFICQQFSAAAERLEKSRVTQEWLFCPFSLHSWVIFSRKWLENDFSSGVESFMSHSGSKRGLSEWRGVIYESLRGMRSHKNEAKLEAIPHVYPQFYRFKTDAFQKESIRIMTKQIMPWASSRLSRWFCRGKGHKERFPLLLYRPEESWCNSV